jgi:hypothetical protein
MPQNVHAATLEMRDSCAIIYERNTSKVRKRIKNK